MKILISESQYKTLNEKLLDISGDPIYHMTNDINALRIIYNDTLRGSVVSEDDILSDKTLAMSKHRMMVSFTRDKNFKPSEALAGGEGIDERSAITFVVDKNRLKTKYRVLPFNYWDIQDKYYQRHHGTDTPQKYKDKRTEESEERVLTDKITPLSRYIIDVKYDGGSPEIKHIVNTYKTSGVTPELQKYMKTNFPVIFMKY